ncbi:MAG: rhodanese-like domain-containing protein [Chloroflexota bacterium]
MAKTFRQMVAEGREGTPMLSPQETDRRMKEESGTLVVDVRDADGLAGTGIIPGAINVSLGTLPLRADQELPEAMRHADLQDRDRPIITTCGGGGQASLAAKVLRDMGFTNVSILEGGTNGWKAAGLPTVAPGENK